MFSHDVWQWAIAISAVGVDLAVVAAEEIGARITLVTQNVSTCDAVEASGEVLDLDSYYLGFYSDFLQISYPASDFKTWQSPPSVAITAE